MYKFNSKLYAIQGLSHLGISEGSVIEIYNDSIWKYKEVLKLAEAPKLILRNGDENLILTSGRYIYIQTADNLEQVLQAPFHWGMLYPSSMFLDNKDLFIAMRKGILKIQDYNTNPIYEWYIPK